MKIFLFPNPEPPYNLAIRYPVYDSTGRPAGITDDEWLDQCIAGVISGRNLDPDIPIYIVDSAEVPGDHICNKLLGACELFDAWEWQVDQVVCNMTKARAIHMDRIRTARNAELVVRDVTFMRAVEAGDASAQSTIATEKQVLRDIPATFDITTGVDTPEKLKAKWPAELPARES
jgi:hypothetical protein